MTSLHMEKAERSLASSPQTTLSLESRLEVEQGEGRGSRGRVSSLVSAVGLDGVQSAYLASGDSMWGGRLAAETAHVGAFPVAQAGPHGSLQA